MNKYQEVTQKLNNHGLVLVTQENAFKGTNGKSQLMCSKGHVWESKICNVLLEERLARPSKGCPQCAAEMKNKNSEEKAEKNLMEGHQILRHFNKIGSTGIAERHFFIKCPFNHTYNKATRGISEGCPECNKVTFVGEERTRLIFETQFQQSFSSIRPDWLKSEKSGRNLELDGFCEDLKIAFEYQGRQHFSNSTQFGGDYEFQYVRDKLKAQLCAEHGVQLITIIQPRNYSADKFFNSVVSDCEKQGIDITVTHSDCEFHKINDSNTLVKKYKEFKEFVESKQYKLNSTSLSTMKDILDFECIDGHKFKMTPENFKVTYSRPQYEKVACAVCNNKENSHNINNLITIDTCKQIAEQLGYKIESTVYENINAPLIWTCKHGHNVSKSFRQMIRNQTGQYCPICKEMKLEDSISLLKPKATSKVSKSSLGEVRDINWLNIFTEKNKITNTDGVYLGMDIKHNFCCSKMHSFVSTISNLVEKEKKNTSMCPDDACGGKSIGLDECKNFSGKNGIVCLSEKYENVNTPMDWQCNNGHTFTKTYRQFQRNKTASYCPQCAGVKIKTFNFL